MTANRSITSKAAANFVAWQLSRRGWNVRHSARNIRGSELLVEDASKTKSFSVQPRGLSGSRTAVGLGRENLDKLSYDWCVVTVSVHTDKPTSYLLRKSEVVQHAIKNSDGSQWLEYRDYSRQEYCEAWHRIGKGSS
jgi:hypothetical protein